MVECARVVIGGVDTHGLSHQAAVMDSVGRILDTAEFDSKESGYRSLLAWLRRHGKVHAVGVEGTGTYGAGLCRHLLDGGVSVIEVDRPDRRARRSKGKSDALDAEAAARAVLSGTATTQPKPKTGTIESIRALRTARSSAVKARTAAMNALRALLVTGPGDLRREMEGIPGTALVRACAGFRPDPTQLGDPRHATKAALRSLARRIQMLTAEVQDADNALEALVKETAPRTMSLLGIGTDHAGQLLVTAGGNPERLRSEAAFARLCGVAPIPASSGRSHRHRLHRGGDRNANRALHLAVVVRLRFCSRTKRYLERRTAEGFSRPEIMRCLKRYLAREVFRAIRADLRVLEGA